MMEKKIICFSLWGDLPIYLHGAEQNIKLAQTFYPDWICRFYVDNSVSKDYLKHLYATYKNCEFYLVNRYGSWGGLLTRFLVADDEAVDRFIVRDCDSRLSEREKIAVDDWVSSGKMFHCMKDHPWHSGVPILGGMWGAKRGFLGDRKISDLMNDWTKNGTVTQKGPDQFFLRDVIYPIVHSDTLQHNDLGVDLHIPFGVTKEFPSKRIDYRFIGERFDENDKPCGDAAHPEHWRILKSFLDSEGVN